MGKSEVRIDKWLWAVRVFKTRTIATEAIKKGRVTVGDNPTPVKPSRTIKVGDTVSVRKPPVTYTFRVLALTENRLGAKLVPEYMENITPQSQYDLLEVVKISGFVDRRKGLGRPTKREGRELSKFTESVYDDGWDFDFDIDDDDDEARRFNSRSDKKDREPQTGFQLRLSIFFRIVSVCQRSTISTRLPSGSRHAAMYVPTIVSAGSPTMRLPSVRSNSVRNFTPSRLPVAIAT